MLPLLLAIVCSASIALIFRRTESADMNRYAVTAANYVVAAGISGLMALFSAGGGDPAPVADAGAEVLNALTGSGEALSPAAGRLWAVVCGLGAGGLFFLGFVFYQLSVRRHGVALSGAFAKIGILVPMALSLVLWRERPGPLQWVGIALALAGIVAANPPPAGDWRRAARPALLLLFLFGGAAEVSNKVFQQYGRLEHKDLFLFATFSTALAVSLAALIWKRRPVARRDILSGFLVGAPNLFCSWFLILALDRLPAAAVFPVYGAGTVLVLLAAGRLLYGEKLSPGDKAAVALSAASLVLLHLGRG